MMECVSSSQESGGCQLSGGAQPYVKLEEAGWSGAGEQGLQHAIDQRDPAAKKKPKVLRRLLDLPTRCWTERKNESRGCQYCAKIRFGPIVLDVMFDSGAGLNTIPEEALLSIINACEAAGIRMSDPRHPVIELQSWANQETCKGVAGGIAVPLIGAVILAMTFVDRNSGRTQIICARFKILASGTTDWVPIILGGMAIDSVDRGGLGIQAQKNSFYVAAFGMSIERSKRFTRGRYGRPTNA